MNQGSRTNNRLYYGSLARNSLTHTLDKGHSVREYTSSLNNHEGSDGHRIKKPSDSRLLTQLQEREKIAGLDKETISNNDSAR